MLVGESASEDIRISNTGTADLKDVTITSSDLHFSVSPTSIEVIAPGESAIVTVTFSPTAEQSYSATITIKSNDPDEPSVDVSAVGNGVSAPAWPTDLVAKAVSDSEIDLSWTDNSDNEDGFRIQRREDGSDTWSDIATLLPNTTSYRDAGLKASTTYYYRVYTFNSAGVSLCPNEAYDTTFPSSPSLTIVGSCDTYDACGVYLVGDYAYIADSYYGLKIINISDPTNPALVSSFDTSNTKGVYVSGGFAYIADDTYGLKIINVSDPKNPSLEGSCDTPGYAYGVYVSGSHAYVADYYKGLQIINISDPKNPTIVASYKKGYAYDVYVSGNYAYVADYYYLTILNISDPENPSLEGYCETPGSALGVYVSGSYAYVADGYKSGLQVISVSDPKNPVIVGSCVTYNAKGIYVSGEYAYIADWNEGLKVISVSDPGNPSLVGSCDTPGYAKGVYVSGSYAYVAAGYYGLQIISITSSDEAPLPPEAPTDLRATTLSSSQIELSWTDNSNNEEGFKIQRREDGSDIWYDIATVGTGTTSYLDTGLKASTTYYYRVYAFNSGGDSAYVEDFATTFDPPDIGVIPLSLDFGDVMVGESSSQDITISNTGADDLKDINISSSDSHFSVSPTYIASIAPGSLATVSVSFAPSAEGAYSATITITSNDPDEPSVGVSVTGEGITPSELIATLTVSVEDLTALFSFSGTDSDGGTLKFTLDFGDGSSIAGEIASGAQMQVKHTYAEGEYTATLTIKNWKGQEATATASVSATQPSEPKLVWLKVSYDKNIIKINNQTTFSVKGGYSDGTTSTDVPVSWSSYDTSIATVDAQGNITGKARGISVITATSTENPDISDSETVFVYKPWPGTLIKIDLEIQTNLTRVDHYVKVKTTFYLEQCDGTIITRGNLWTNTLSVTWNLDETVAKATNIHTIKAVGVGNTDISLTVEGVTSNTVNLEVLDNTPGVKDFWLSPASGEGYGGTSGGVKVEAIGLYEDGYETCVPVAEWSLSPKPEGAKIALWGCGTGAAVTYIRNPFASASYTIIAKLEDGRTAEAEINIIPAYITKIKEHDDVTLMEGHSYLMAARVVLNTGQRLTLGGGKAPIGWDTTTILGWKSSDESIATISVEGKVTAVAKGETWITVYSKAHTSVSSTIRLKVIAHHPASDFGIFTTDIFRVIGYLKDGTKVNFPDSLGYDDWSGWFWRRPMAVSYDPTDSTLIVIDDCSYVYKINWSDASTTVIYVYAPSDGPSDSPTKDWWGFFDMATDDNGNTYVQNEYDGAIYKLAFDEEQRKYVVSMFSDPNANQPDDDPWGGGWYQSLTLDSDGNLWVSDEGPEMEGIIWKIAPDGTRTQFAITGTWSETYKRYFWGREGPIGLLADGTVLIIDNGINWYKDLNGDGTADESERGVFYNGPSRQKIGNYYVYPYSFREIAVDSSNRVYVAESYMAGLTHMPMRDINLVRGLIDLNWDHKAARDSRERAYTNKGPQDIIWDLHRNQWKK